MGLDFAPRGWQTWARDTVSFALGKGGSFGFGVGFGVGVGMGFGVTFDVGFGFCLGSVVHIPLTYAGVGRGRG